MADLTTAQIENIVIDIGVVYINYGETDERILAPCKGDNNFVVEQKFSEIEVGGIRSKAKGLKMMQSENAKLTVNLLDLSQENLHMALVNSQMDATSKAITNGDGRIANTDYLTNVTLVGKTFKDEYKIITIYNALAEGGVKIKTSDKDETVLEVTFDAHIDPTDSTKPLYKIEHVATLV